MSGGFNNPIVGGGGNLVYPSIQSPNFSLSGQTGWAILKNGNAYFFNITASGIITATQLNIIGTGAFAGRLIKAFLSGGNPEIQFLSGRLAEVNPTTILMSLLNSGLPNEIIQLLLQGPTVTGQPDFASLNLQSAAENGSGRAGGNLLYTDTVGTLHIPVSWGAGGLALSSGGTGVLSIDNSVYAAVFSGGPSGAAQLDDQAAAAPNVVGASVLYSANGQVKYSSSDLNQYSTGRKTLTRTTTLAFTNVLTSVAWDNSGQMLINASAGSPMKYEFEIEALITNGATNQAVSFAMSGPATSSAGFTAFGSQNGSTGVLMSNGLTSLTSWNSGLLGVSGGMVTRIRGYAIFTANGFLNWQISAVNAATLNWATFRLMPAN